MATYNISKNNLVEYDKGDILNCPYTGKKINIKLLPGIYQLEVWGGEGGNRGDAAYAGKGGYSKGTINLKEETQIYCYSGGSGNTGKTNGGFNGGGRRNTYNGGGGGSDIRIGQDSLYARVIVAGGGGSCGNYSRSGGYGGGLNGGQSNPTYYGSGGYYGTQTGVYNNWKTNARPTATSGSTSNAYGGFGFGGNGLYYSNGYGGAGGGGWYGGSGTDPDGSGDDDQGGGGGSGYVYTSASATNYPSGCLLNSNYYLTNTQMIAGNQTIKEPNGSNQTGHYGNGYIRITVIEVQSLPIKIKVNGEWKKIKNLYQKINGTWKKSSKVKIKINNSWK